MENYYEDGKAFSNHINIQCTFSIEKNPWNMLYFKGKFPLYTKKWPFLSSNDSAVE